MAGRDPCAGTAPATLGHVASFYVVYVAAIVVVIALAVIELRAAEDVDEQPAGYAWARALLVGLMFLPLSLTWGVGADDPPMPTAAPVVPRSGSGCSGGGETIGLLGLLIVFGIYALFRFGPSLLAYLLARRRTANWRMITGRRVLFVSGGLGAFVLAACIVRTIAWGQPVESIDTYGAVTPPGAGGWRARLVIDRLRTGPLRPLPLSEEPEAYAEYKEGSHGFGSYWRLLDGEKIYVAGEPRVLVLHGDGWHLHPITNSYEARYPPSQRAQFQTAPQIAVTDDGFLLMERRADGSYYAVLFDKRARQTRATLGQAGPLLRPPALALVIVLLIAAGVSAWGWYEWRQRKSAAGRLACVRLAAAWAYAELTLVLYVAFRWYW